MRTLAFAFLAFATSLLVCADVQSATSAPSLTGRWEVTTSYPGGSFVAGVTFFEVVGRIRIDGLELIGIQHQMKPFDSLYCHFPIRGHRTTRYGR